MVRTSAFFGPWDPHNFLALALHALASGQTFAATEEATVSPTYVPDLVNACLDLLVDGESGLWHLANASEGVSWAQFARDGARLANVSAAGLKIVPRAEIGWVAARPAYSVLGSERAVLLPPLESALHRYAGHYVAGSVARRDDLPGAA